MQSNVNSGNALSGNLVLINFSALFILISDPVVIHKIFKLTKYLKTDQTKNFFLPTNVHILNLSS